MLRAVWRGISVLVRIEQLSFAAPFPRVWHVGMSSGAGTTGIVPTI